LGGGDDQGIGARSFEPRVQDLPGAVNIPALRFTEYVGCTDHLRGVAHSRDENQLAHLTTSGARARPLVHETGGSWMPRLEREASFRQATIATSPAKKFSCPKRSGSL